MWQHHGANCAVGRTAIGPSTITGLTALAPCAAMTPGSAAAYAKSHIMLGTLCGCLTLGCRPSAHLHSGKGCGPSAMHLPAVSTQQDLGVCGGGVDHGAGVVLQHLDRCRDNCIATRPSLTSCLLFGPLRLVLLRLCCCLLLRIRLLCCCLLFADIRGSGTDGLGCCRAFCGGRAGGCLPRGCLPCLALPFGGCRLPCGAALSAVRLPGGALHSSDSCCLKTACG
jgi:hypothetical protein